ncbi:MAG: trypsin-like peptidase domain-containing protein [Verrucomicrobiae bacterium]|nr:trypsin-like peptidase domain-containing protein [Verrucomicrobiae bacterium]
MKRYSGFCLCILLFFLTVPGGRVHAVPATAAPPLPAGTPDSVDVARALGRRFADVVEKVSAAVVVITVTRSASGVEGGAGPGDESGDPNEYYRRNPRKPGPMPYDPGEGQGSGFIVRSDGYIFTNNHVIQGAESLKVRLKDGRIFDAQVVGTPDDKTDVAVIRIKAQNLPVVEMGNSETIRPGEWTIAIGAPFNLDYSVTVGVLSGKVRDRLGATIYEEYLQTQATINPGNSGGPLLDIDGRVIGVNTLIRTRQGFNFYNANVGFAIPINLAQKIGQLLMTKGKIERPWLGIDIEDLAECRDRSQIGAVGVEKGVVVRGIRPDTPAYDSGLKPADVITAIDGVAVGAPRELQKQVLKKKIGQQVNLTIIRRGRSMVVAMTTGLQPSMQQMAGMPHMRQPNLSSNSFGMTVQPLTRELSEQLGFGEKQGVLVTDVDEGAAAAQSGVQPGMIIIEVDGRKVTSGQALKEALGQADPKKGALMIVSRDRFRTYIFFRPMSEGRGGQRP